MKYFQQIVCPDEKVFSTLYGEYAREYSQDGTTFAKWAGGPHPATPTRDDIKTALARNQFWFARKFSSRDSDTLDWLDGLRP